MDKKNQKQRKFIPQGRSPKASYCYYSEQEKHRIVQAYLNSGLTKREVWERYTGRVSEHGEIKRWMRKLGYNEAEKLKINIFAKNKKRLPMNKKIEISAQEFENLQLKKRILELEQEKNELAKALSKEKIKTIAFSTMVDIAEQEFGIVIKKKFNTKPLKS